MNIYVIRHGQTDWNIENLMLGESDISINKEGVNQALNAKSQIDKLDYDIVFCSPMKRTRQTCKIINRGKNRSVIYDDRLVERICGEIEGLSEEEFHYKKIWNYYNEMKYKNAEDVQTLFKRVFDFLNEIKEKYKDKNILIVTHSGVCRTIRCYFNGIPKDGKLYKFKQKNCEIKKYKA